MLQALIECDSLGQAHLKQLMDYRAGEYLRPPRVMLKNNILTVTAKTDSLKLRIEWLEREIYNVKSATYVEYRDVPVNYITWWQHLWIVLGQTLSIILFLLILYKLIKKYYGK